MITKAGAKAGVKPTPKDVVSAGAHMAKEEGQDPKEAAKKMTSEIMKDGKKVKDASSGKNNETVVKPG